MNSIVRSKNNVKNNTVVTQTKVAHELFSHTYAPVAPQFGGNRLSGAGRPQMQKTGDLQKAKNNGAFVDPHQTQTRIGMTGVHGGVGGKVPFNNQPVRQLAGTHAMIQIPVRAQNSLMNQRSSKATARGLSGLNTTSRRGGSSQTGMLKSVAGTSDTFNVGGTGGHSSNTVQTTSHYIGLHRIVVTKKTSPNPSRPGGKITPVKGAASVTDRPRGRVFQR